MQLRTLLLATAALLVQTSAGYAAEEKYESTTTVEKDNDGNYQRKDVTTKTDVAGNTESLEKKVDVGVDNNGNYKKTVKTKSVSDPKGLLNKHVVEITDSHKIKDGKVESTHEKKVDGKNVLGEKDKYKTDTKVSEDANGNYDEKTTVTNTDPNGTKITYEKKAVVDVKADGSIDKSTTTKEIKDPKGMLNKKTVATANTQTIENGIVTSGQEISVDGKVVDSQKQVEPQ